MQTLPLHFTHSLKCHWSQGEGKIKYNPDSIEQAIVILSSQAFDAPLSIQPSWRLEALSQKERFVVLTTEKSACLKLQVEEQDNSFRVNICIDPQRWQKEQSKERQEKYRQILDSLNEEFIPKHSRLFEQYKDWYGGDPENVRSIFWRVIENARDYEAYAKAASNAISLLNHLRESFSQKDLSRISMPQADLSGAILQEADLSHVDLRKGRLINACLLGADLTNAHLEGVELGVQPYLEHDEEIEKLALSADDSYLAVWTEQGKITLWNFDRSFSSVERNPTTLKLVSNKFSQKVKELGFNTDHSLLLVANGSYIEILRVGSLQIIKTISLSTSEDVWTPIVRFSPNGDWIAYTTRNLYKLNFMKLRDQREGELITEESSWDVESDWIVNGCFSPHSEVFAFITYRDWKTNLSCWLHSWVLGKKVSLSLQISQFKLYDQLKFATDSRLWLIENKKDKKSVIWEFEVTEHGIGKITSPRLEVNDQIEQTEYISTTLYKNHCLYTTKESNFICMIDFDLQKEVCRFMTFTPNLQVQISQKKDFILSSWSKTLVAILKIEYLAQHGIFRGKPIKNFYFNFDSQSIIIPTFSHLNFRDYFCIVTEYLIEKDQHNFSYELNLTKHDQHRGILKRTLDPLLSPGNSHIIVQFLGDGKYYKEDNVRLYFSLLNRETKRVDWHYRTKNKIDNHTFVLASNCEQIAFLFQRTQNGKTLFEIQVWNTTTNCLLLEHDVNYSATSQEVLPLTLLISSTPTFVPTGYLSVAIGSQIFLIQIDAGFLKICHQIFNDCNKAVRQLHLLHNCLYILKKDEQVIRYWDIQEEKEQSAFEGPQAEILSFAVSSDGTRLACLSRDQGLFLWDVASRERIDIKTHADLTEVKFSPDGQRLVTYEEAIQMFYVWEIQGKELHLIRVPKKLDCRGANIKDAHFDEDGLNKKVLQQLGASE